MEMFGLSRESMIPDINLPDLVQTVFSALAAARLEPGRLELEITETALLPDNEVVLEKLHQLKRSKSIRASFAGSANVRTRWRSYAP